jgi:tRNA (cytidine32/uridine32-2'-O)-methyltransferase
MNSPRLPIRIVLVDTSHPGNIGAAARAMKNMLLDDLVLVRPRSFPDPEALARAAGADDVLERARVVQSLDEALTDCAVVIGTTARPREHRWDVIDVHEAAPRLLAAEQSAFGQGPVAAVLFGSERFGLTNEELLRCNWLTRIPANPQYESLNVAMAVQIVCYELFKAGGVQRVQRVEHLGDITPLAASADVQRFYEHLEAVMQEVGFTDRTQSKGHLMGRIKRLFNRAQLDQNEVNILRGFLTAVQERRRRAGGA